MAKNQRLGERRKFARDARRALSMYLYYLQPNARLGLTEEQVLSRRRSCLNDAQYALDWLEDIQEDVEPREED